MPIAFGRPHRSGQRPRSKRHRTWNRDKMLQRVAQTEKFPAVFAIRFRSGVKISTTFTIRGTLNALASDREKQGISYRLLGYHWAANIQDAEKKAQECRKRLVDYATGNDQFDVSDEAFLAAVHQSSIGKCWLDTVPTRKAR